MDRWARRRRVCGGAALWIAVGGRRAPLRGSRRDAGFGSRARARGNRLEVQSIVDGAHLMDVTLNSARIHYERSGSGFPLLLIHAGIADSRMWEPQAKAFANQFDMVRPDLRGFGDSKLPPVPYSMLADMIALLDYLDIDRAHVVGCSMGGTLAIDFALEHPQ